MSTLEKTHIQLGYIPLLDCISILWAKHCGYFDELGLDVTLVKEAALPITTPQRKSRLKL